MHFGRLTLEREIKKYYLERLSFAYRQGHLLAYSLRGHVLVFFFYKVISHFTFPCANLLFTAIVFIPSKILLLELYEKIKLYSKGEE